MGIATTIKNTPVLRPIYTLGRDIKMLGLMTESDRHYITRKFMWRLHYKPNLDHPESFQEKLQWIKLHDRKPIYHTMVDKYDAKRFIADTLGDDKYCIPTLGVYDSFDDIDFDALPNQFVLKCTFDSGSYYICTDKSKIDRKKVKDHLYVNWRYNYYYYSREWPYKGLKHRIIAEPLLRDEKCPYLRDFKFYCFNGEPQVMYITSDKGGDLPTRQDFFDMEGNHLELQDAHYTNNPVKCPDLPVNFEKMKELCRIFAKNTYHLRVDFYEINDNIYCGEFTFFESGGFCEFMPDKYNRILGEWIKLPIDK